MKGGPQDASPIDLSSRPRAASQLAHWCPALPANHAHLELSSNLSTVATTPESAAAPTRLVWQGPGYNTPGHLMLLWPTLSSSCSLAESECEHGQGGVRKRPLWQTAATNCHTEGSHTYRSSPRDPQARVRWVASASLSSTETFSTLMSAFQAMLKVRV